MVVDQVAAWRVRGRLPLGIDITACIVETMLRDPHHQAKMGVGEMPISNNMLRIQYSLAIIRCCNVVVLHR
jgi:ribosomal biogenesis protein LAS1